MSDKSGIVADQLVGYISSWERGGAVVERDRWSVDDEAWTVATYSPEVFGHVHSFIAATPKGQCVVVCSSMVRDLGLFAMEHPDTYVATVEVLVDEELSQVDHRFYDVLEEARNFSGPAVVVVLLHEKPFLFRYNPRAEVTFSPDSGTMSSLIESFLQREEQMVLFLAKVPDASQQDSAGALSAGLASAEAVTVLYGSDTGHSEECARKISRLIKSAGRPVKAMTMNSFTDPLTGLVLFVTSTAGKGDFPANATKFWSGLANRTERLEGLTFATLSLGDSHYWPEYEHFAASGRRLDAKLLELGATSLIDMVIGDDQDPDGYRLGYSKWETDLKSALGLKVSAEAPVAEEGAHKTPEQAKYDSHYFRGTLATTLRDRTTGGIPQPDQVVIKHHGIYQQDDRDMREERGSLGLEPAYMFMIRVRKTAGDANAAEWRAMDDIANTLARPNLKITTRQTWQVQGIQKHNLIESVRMIQRAAMDTIAACGDVARNVCCTSNPMACSPAVMDEVVQYSKEIHDYVLPKSSAWHEVFILDGPGPKKKYQVGGSTPFEEEPLYGRHYLPRKFKMAVAIPPYNDVDIYSHDIGFIAIVENGVLQGFNILLGGGLGYTHNNRNTFPRLGTMFGYVSKESAKLVAEMVMVVQRDHGDRTDRKHARLKYTLHDKGFEWFKAQIEDLLGFNFEPARPFEFTERTDQLGWMHNEAGWHIGLFIEDGKVKGKELEGLRKIADLDLCRFRMTCNQSVALTHIREEKKATIEALLNEYGIRWQKGEISGLRAGSFACAALPLCVMAFAEAERYLPVLITNLELELQKHGLFKDDFVIRMTGCPNSCGRPELAEIGLVGQAPGTYKLYLGGDHLGYRANRIYKEAVDEAGIISALSPLFADYAANRQKDERFGNFCVRTGIVKENKYGPDYHDF